MLRWTLSETAGIDDVDQVLRSQIWSWGYGPQPPLYTWLVKSFLGILGYSVFSLLLLKESLILCVYALVYAITVDITGDRLRGLLATALLQANFSIAWEAHRELTHTVLATVLSLVTIHSFLSLKSDRWMSYLWFGTCTALGVLSKYNFAFLWLALLLGGVMVRDLRAVIFHPKMLGACLLALALCAPHFVWCLHHGSLALSSVQKLKLLANDDWALLGTGVAKWLLAVLAHVGPMVVLVILMFPRELHFAGSPFVATRLLWRTGCWVVFLVIASIVLFRVTGVRDRYAQPLFVWAPILFVALLKTPLSSKKIYSLVFVGAVSLFAIALIAPGRILLTERLKKTEVLNTPFRNLASDMRPLIQANDCIIAENHVLAGNLRLWFPDKLVIDPEVGPLFKRAPRDGVMVWNAGSNSSPPADLLRFAITFTGGRNLGQVQTIEEVLKYHHSKVIRIGVAALDLPGLDADL